MCSRFANVTEKGSLSSTWHVYRTPLVSIAAVAQLPIAVVAPALDLAPSRDDARVALTRRDGDGGDAWPVW